VQASTIDRHQAVGRYHVDMIRHGQGTIGCLAHRHPGPVAEDLGQHADVVGGEMQYDHKCHAIVPRHMLEKAT
jgi:hypothetical protein